MENILFIFITLVFFTLISAHIYLTNVFFTHLKTSHKEAWKRLGQPQWKIHFGDDSFQNAMKYIRKKQFSELNDPSLDAIYKKIKNIEYTAILLALLIMLVTLIDIFTQG